MKTKITRMVLPTLSGCIFGLFSVVYGADAPKDFKAADFSGPVFALQQGTGGFYAIAEAENLPHSSKWVKRADAGKTGVSGCSSKGAVGSSFWDPANYTGTGYVRWTGGSLGSGGSQESDTKQTLQGTKDNWLVMKIWAESNQAGTYKCTPRVYHLQQDGDNDWWAAYIGQTGTISRAANCNKEQYAYTSWSGSNLTSVKIVAGLNAVYIAGRSNGIGVDRIVVTNMGSNSEAYNGKTAQTPQKSTSVTRESQISMTARSTSLAAGDIVVIHDISGRRIDRSSSILSSASKIGSSTGCSVLSIVRNGECIRTVRDFRMK